MKKSIKNGLSKLGLFSYLDGIRRVPQVLGWLRRGCTGPAPPPVKRQIIKAYLQRHQLQGFVETGTYLGDTLAHIAKDESIACISIELDENLYRNASERFRSQANIHLLNGDSGEVLPEIMEKLPGPTLFWLDGHFSGGITAQGKSDTPVSKELQTILDSRIKKHVILIDDARCFDGTKDYPFLEELLSIVRRHSEYTIEVSADIVRLTPSSGEIN